MSPANEIVGLHVREAALLHEVVEAIDRSADAP